MVNKPTPTAIAEQTAATSQPNDRKNMTDDAATARKMTNRIRVLIGVWFFLTFPIWFLAHDQRGPFS
jgi:hypothetical protein